MKYRDIERKSIPLINLPGRCKIYELWMNKKSISFLIMVYTRIYLRRDFLD